jgi:hypothetical protein
MDDVCASMIEFKGSIYRPLCGMDDVLDAFGASSCAKHEGFISWNLLA